jgi:SAM-dependent methyltransferase
MHRKKGISSGDSARQWFGNPRKRSRLSQEDWFDEISLRRPNNEAPTNPFENSWILQAIEELVPSMKQNITVLEVGCGDGSSGTAQEIINRGFGYIGLDISKQSIHRLSKSLNQDSEKVWLVTGTVDQNFQEISSYKPSIAIICQTLHHIEEAEIRSIIRSLRKLLTGSAAVIVYEPNSFYPLWRIMGFYNKDFRWSHERGISQCSKKRITAAFTANGFTLEKHLYTRLLPLRIMELAKMKKDFLASVPIIKKMSQYQLFVFRSSDD